MYKVTIKETVGEILTETVIETEDVGLVKEILVSKNILKVETDVPNESIDPGMLDLQDFWRKQMEEMAKRSHDPLKPYRDSSIDWPFVTPFTVTC